MELTLERQPVWLMETVLETTAEQPLECDALLPDSCPDLGRLLRCGVRAWVSNRSFSGSQLELDGMAEVTVFYLSEQGELHRAVYRLPFAKTIELKNEVQTPAMTVQCKAGYLNGRVVNPRRLDLRGALNLSVRVMGCREEQAITSGEGGGLQLRPQHSAAIRLLGEVYREISVEETQAIPYGKTPVEEILSVRGIPKGQEWKITGEQVLVKGELEVSLFYRTGEGTAQTTMTFPLATVAEIPGMEEQNLCSVRMFLQSCEAEPQEDGIQVTAEVQAQIRVFQEVENGSCGDCYSTQYQCTFRSKNFNGLRLDHFAKENLALRETMSLAEPAEEVLDLWCEPAGCSIRVDGESISADGKVLAVLLVRMSSGEIHAFEKSLECKALMQAGGENASTDLQLTTAGCSASFSARDTVEIRCDAVLEGAVFLPAPMQAVDDIVVEEKKPRTDTVPAGLYLYLSAAGESMWEIARRYNTSAERILEENPDGGEEGALLIPVSDTV